MAWTLPTKGFDWSADSRVRAESTSSPEIPGHGCPRSFAVRFGFTDTLRRKPSPLWALAVTLLMSGCGIRSSTVNPSPSVPVTENLQASSSIRTVFDLAGQSFDPFDTAGVKAIVFLFVSTDCPISNRYAPEIRRVKEKFARAGVRLWLVYDDPDTSADAIKKHLHDYQLPPEALRDPQHGLVRLSQAHVTPEAAVFLPGRQLVYHGRIDNRYADLGKERPEATQHDLEDVLEAVVHGKPVPYPTARDVGCYISDVK